MNATNSAATPPPISVTPHSPKRPDCPISIGSANTDRQLWSTGASRSGRVPVLARSKEDQWNDEEHCWKHDDCHNRDPNRCNREHQDGIHQRPCDEGPHCGRVAKLWPWSRQALPQFGPFGVHSARVRRNGTRSARSAVMERRPDRQFGRGVRDYAQGVALQVGLSSVTVPVVSCVSWLPSRLTV
jgi:hypothetical protein